MASRAELRATKWKVFLDGVEVPHQGFQIMFSKDALSTGSITLEPDQSLANLRPQTVVSVFAKDRYPDDDVEYEDELDVKFNYYLYWEGLVSGMTYDKSPESRAVRINCESIFAPWTRTKAYAFGIGQYPKSSVLSGSLAVNLNAEVGSDIYSFADLAKDMARDTGRKFLDRLVESVAKLSAFNSNLRLQSSRYRLFNKIGGILDDSLDKLLGPMAEGLYTNAVQQLGENSSVFDVFTHLQKYTFSSSYELPAPVPQPVEANSFIEPPGLSGIYWFEQAYKQTQLMSLPEMYYVMPPPCNFIFPDDVSGLTVNRDFYNESTRTLMPDPHADIGQTSFYLAPPTILRALTIEDRANITGAELIAQVTNAIQDSEDNNLTSPHEVRLSAGTEDDPDATALFSTLNAMSNEEIEKGIISAIESYPFETLAATVFQSDSPDIQLAYSSFMTSVVEYRHNLASYNRPMTVQMAGHRNLAPGFTAAIFDSDISYIALIDSVAIAVDPIGGETTSATFSKARPIQLLDYEALDDVVNAVAVEAFKADKARERIELRQQFSGDDNEIVKARLLEIELGTAREINNILQPIKELHDVPIAPSFLNPELTNLESLDKIYQEFLGCKPFYTSKYATDRVPSAITDTLTREDTVVPDNYKEFLQGKPTATSAVETNALLSYATAMTALNNVYRMGSTKNLYQNTNTDNLTSWQDINGSQDPLGITTNEWTNRTFTKRRRLTMAKYLADNELILEQEVSTGISREYFYSMRPASTDANGWDNTPFSKLVKETRSDERIDAARETASDILKTSTRQELIREYSIRHFGSRGFNGA